jgi:hypothetical protein
VEEDGPVDADAGLHERPAHLLQRLIPLTPDRARST